MRIISLDPSQPYRKSTVAGGWGHLHSKGHGFIRSRKMDGIQNAGGRGARRATCLIILSLNAMEYLAKDANSIHFVVAQIIIYDR
jgi:hypothetical protein